MNKICVYAIAKNEEKNVEAWYNSMRQADHIIVLDTGSTDRTVELLASLGIEVHQKTYSHFRFDVARNDSLDLVPSEYNIRVCTDLDERFENDNWAQILRDNWDENNPRVVYSYVWNHLEDGQPGLIFIINKIHGTDKNLRWTGAVHEHLTDMTTGRKDFDNYINLTQQIVLHHYEDISKDRHFYLDLTKERVEENLNDFYAWLQWAGEYRVNQDYKKAIQVYEQTLQRFDNMDTINKAGAYYWLGKCYNYIGEGVQAMKNFAAGIGINYAYRDNYCGLAELFIGNNMPNAAIGILQECLEKNNRFEFWLEDPFNWSYYLYQELAMAYAQKEQFDKALAYNTKALSFDTQNQELLTAQQQYINKLK